MWRNASSAIVRLPIVRHEVISAARADLDLRGVVRDRPDGPATLERGFDEAVEQRVRVIRPRLELRVELRRDEERMVRQFDDLYQPVVRGQS
mgnify:CR=1 FL=1